MATKSCDSDRDLNLDGAHLSHCQFMRRSDDGYDPGHGKRAARLVDFCSEYFLRPTDRQGFDNCKMLPFRVDEKLEGK